MQWYINQLDFILNFMNWKKIYDWKALIPNDGLIKAVFDKLWHIKILKIMWSIAKNNKNDTKTPVSVQRSTSSSFHGRFPLQHQTQLLVHTVNHTAHTHTHI